MSAARNQAPVRTRPACGTWHVARTHDISLGGVSIGWGVDPASNPTPCPGRNQGSVALAWCRGEKSSGQYLSLIVMSN
jgi:hypothetical protein